MIDNDKIYYRDPYKNQITAAYNTAVNILAVEFLVKRRAYSIYDAYCVLLDQLTADDLSCLFVRFDLNRHPENLGAMITQGDYDDMFDDLIYILEHPEELVSRNA